MNEREDARMSRMVEKNVRTVRGDVVDKGVLSFVFILLNPILQYNW